MSDKWPRAIPITSAFIYDPKTGEKKEIKATGDKLVFETDDIKAGMEIDLRADFTITFVVRLDLTDWRYMPIIWKRKSK